MGRGHRIVHGGGVASRRVGERAAMKWWMVEAGWWCTEGPGYCIVEEDSHKWYIYPHDSKTCIGPYKTLKAAIKAAEERDGIH